MGIPPGSAAHAGNLASNGGFGEISLAMDGGRLPGAAPATECREDGAPERRRCRSRDPLVALTRLLDAVRRRSGTRALALGSIDGLLVAGSGAFRECEEMAAAAAFAGVPAANDVVPSRIDVLGRATEVRRITIDGVEVLLTASGVTNAAALTDAERGCQRILARR